MPSAGHKSRETGCCFPSLPQACALQASHYSCLGQGGTSGPVLVTPLQDGLVLLSLPSHQPGCAGSKAQQRSSIWKAEPPAPSAAGCGWCSSCWLPRQGAAGSRCPWWGGLCRRLLCCSAGYWAHRSMWPFMSKGISRFRAGRRVQLEGKRRKLLSSSCDLTNPVSLQSAQVLLTLRVMSRLLEELVGAT